MVCRTYKWTGLQHPSLSNPECWRGLPLLIPSQATGCVFPDGLSTCSQLPPNLLLFPGQGTRPLVRVPLLGTMPGSRAPLFAPLRGPAPATCFSSLPRSAAHSVLNAPLPGSFEPALLVLSPHPPSLCNVVTCSRRSAPFLTPSPLVLQLSRLSAP